MHDRGPDVSVTIADELRLLRSNAHATPVRASAAPLQRPAYRPSAAKWQRITLRQDGQRPLNFEGAPVFRATCQTQTGVGLAQQSIALFATRAGVVIAEIIALPPDDLAAKPVFRCAPVVDTDGFANFLGNYRPEQCFEVSAGLPAQRPAHQSEAISLMQNALQQMVAHFLMQPHH